MLNVNILSVVRKAEGRERADAVRLELQQKAKNAASFAEASRAIESAFFETMVTNWKVFAVSYARGTLFFFLDPGRFDLYEFLDLPHDFRGYQLLRFDLGGLIRKLRGLPPYVPIYLLCVGTLNVCLLAGFIFFLLARRFSLELELFLIILIGYVLLIVAPTGLSRFRLSVVPFLFLASTPLLERVFKFVMTRKLKKAVS